MQVMSAGASLTSLDLSGLAPAVRQNPNSLYPGSAALNMIVTNEGIPSTITSSSISSSSAYNSGSSSSLLLTAAAALTNLPSSSSSSSIIGSSSSTSTTRSSSPALEVDNSSSSLSSDRFSISSSFSSSSSAGNAATSEVSTLGSQEGVDTDPSRRECFETISEGTGQLSPGDCLGATKTVESGQHAEIGVATSTDFGAGSLPGNDSSSSSSSSSKTTEFASTQANAGSSSCSTVAGEGELQLQMLQPPQRPIQQQQQQEGQEDQDQQQLALLQQRLQRLRLVCDPLLPLDLCRQLVKLCLDWCKCDVLSLQLPLVAAMQSCSRLEHLSLVGYQGDVEEVRGGGAGAG